MQLKCLLVDDSRLVRAIACNHLEALGFVVVEAEDGQDALVQAQQGDFALGLIDWNLPDMSGLEIISNIREKSLLPGIKLLLCSTETRLAAIRAALAQGADSYIAKPFDRDRLEHRLKRFGLI